MLPPDRTFIKETRVLIAHVCFAFNEKGLKFFNRKYAIRTSFSIQISGSVTLTIIFCLIWTSKVSNIATTRAPRIPRISTVIIARLARKKLVKLVDLVTYWTPKIEICDLTIFFWHTYIFENNHRFFKTNICIVLRIFFWLPVQWANIFWLLNSLVCHIFRKKKPILCDGLQEKIYSKKIDCIQGCGNFSININW